MKKLTQKEYKNNYNTFNVYFLWAIRLRKGDNINEIIEEEFKLLKEENIFIHINEYTKATSSLHISFSKGDKMYSLDKNIFILYNIEDGYINFMYKTSRFDTKI